LKRAEFHIFVQAPFATNIHLDALQLENLKEVISRKEPLWVKEYYVLESISKHGKTKDQLFKELKKRIGKFNPSDVSSTIDNLIAAGLIRKDKQLPNTQFLRSIEANRVIKDGIGSTTKALGRPFDEKDTGIFSKNIYSITQEGKERLANSYDKDYYSQFFGVDVNELTDKSLEDFWKQFSKETKINYFPIIDHLPKDQRREKENYFFGDEDRPAFLAKFGLSNFPSEMCLTSPNDLEIHLKFDDNIIVVYGSGVGLFSSTITVEYNGDSSDISKVGNKLEASIKKVIQHNFKKYGSEDELKRYYEWLREKGRLRLVDEFCLGLAKTSKLAWIHLIYYFYGGEFLEGDFSGVSTINVNMRTVFIDLLEQFPENMSFIRDRFVFYGWGRSLILTKSADKSTLEWVEDKVKLVEIGQYSCFGHILIDHLLRRKLSRLVMEGPRLGVQERIKAFDRMRSAIVAYIEEFRSGINTILLSGETSLVSTLENQWRLEKLRESIRYKLQSLNSELSSIEQSLSHEKQDRTNNLVLAFTIMGIASVTTAIISLSPLNEWVDKLGPLLEPDFFFFIILTIIIIFLTVILITEWHTFARWIRSYREQKREYSKYMKKINVTGQLTPQEAIPLLHEIRIEDVNDAYNRRKITRLQHKKLIDEVSLHIKKLRTDGNSIPST
jgi:hypothetical protein